MQEQASPVLRAAKFLRGDGVLAERVPCGDDETDECYALCDKEGCSVVGKVAFIRTLKILSLIHI